MERGLYAAASGMLAQQAIQETLAQNIANANTVGYKQDNPTFRALHGMALRRLADGQGRGPQIGELGLGVSPDQIVTDWQPGPMQTTNQPLDASLSRNQFFAIGTPRGERYTRAGNFQLDGAGNLRTASGLSVLDINNRPINVGNGKNVRIDATGTLTALLPDPNGGPVPTRQTTAKMKIVQIVPGGQTPLAKEGDNLFSATSPAAVRPVANPTLRPGTLEQSNVNPVLGLVQLMTVSRGFDMAQRAIVTQDELLRHAANDLGHL